MARERPIEEKEARKLYEKGMKLKDIAQKLGKADTGAAFLRLASSVGINKLYHIS